MHGINRVVLMGNLGADPFKTSTLTGKTLTTFNLATNEFVKEVEGDKIIRTEWHKVVTWGKTAEACARMLRKGSKVYIEGHIRSLPKKTEENSPVSYSYEVSATEIVFLSNYGKEINNKDVPEPESESQSQSNGADLFEDAV